MSDETKLIQIKIIHTFVWIAFNFVIFYMLYAAVTNRLDLWLWVGYLIILLEAATLLLFKMSCPLTVLARKYSNSKQDNFDIYLPNWLARNNKLIYTMILIIIVLITLYRIFGG